MIFEAAQFAFTFALAPRSRPAMISDSIGLSARARRCAHAWAAHEAHCKAHVEQAIATADGRGTAVVLGSGLLRDVPVDVLSRSFRHVVLLDVCHLADVRFWAKVRRLRNLQFQTVDVSGYDKLRAQTRIALATGQEDLGVRLDPLAFLRRINDLSLVVSANLLSQMAIGATRRLASGDGLGRAMPDDTPRRLVEAHLDSLAALPCKTLLLTDVEYRWENRQGEVSERVDLLKGVRPPPALNAWEWPVAPFGEERAGEQRVHSVIAVEDVAVDL